MSVRAFVFFYFFLVLLGVTIDRGGSLVLVLEEYVDLGPVGAEVGAQTHGQSGLTHHVDVRLQPSPLCVRRGLVLENAVIFKMRHSVLMGSSRITSSSRGFSSPRGQAYPFPL